MPPTAFSQLVDEWIDGTLAYRPGATTSYGIHEHDGDLGDRSRGAIEARADTLRDFLRRLELIDPAGLERAEAPEYELLRRLRWELIDSEEIASWWRSPAGYLGTIGRACNGLIIRDFAPLPDLARSLVSRLRQARRSFAPRGPQAVRAAWSPQRSRIAIEAPPDFPRTKPNGFFVEPGLATPAGFPQPPASGEERHGKAWAQVCYQPQTWMPERENLWRYIKAMLRRFAEVN